MSTTSASLDQPGIPKSARLSLTTSRRAAQVNQADHTGSAMGYRI